MRSEVSDAIIIGCSKMAGNGSKEMMNVANHSEDSDRRAIIRSYKWSMPPF